MKYRILSIFLFLFLACSVFAQEREKNTVTLLDFKGTIGPASVEYFQKGLQHAVKTQSHLLIFQLNTPGGLSTSMRNMIEMMLASNLPIIVYVSPSGARATSAGTYIVYASTLAAMAPGTHLGSATPVNLGMPTDKPEKSEPSKSSVMERKTLEDATAYIRSLAQLRGRNIQWAETAVSEGKSLSAMEALRLNVVDLIANNVEDLLRQINQKEVKVNDKTITLNTDHVHIDEIMMDWRTRFLGMITDPNIAYLLLLLGIYGLFFEFTSPGLILPGILGGISLLLALYALSLLPVNYVGASLMLLGIVLLILEGYSSGFGLLGLSGIASFAIGSIFLLERNQMDFSISMPLILSITGVTAAFFLIVAQMVIRSHLKPIVSGKEQLIGQRARLIKNSQGVLQIHLEGEAWNVASDSEIKADQEVEVIGIKGLTLFVKPIDTK